MALTDTQVRQLKAKLDPKHVKTRRANDRDLHYIEGWHAVAEANRIFGYDAWDRRTLANSCIWSGSTRGDFIAAYTARVRICVRAGDVRIVRDGSGSGEGRAASKGQAHELALKAAETDATKRALATFGNRFGLALYDPEQRGVRKTKLAGRPQPAGPWVLRCASGREVTKFDRPSSFAVALRQAMSEERDMEALFALWEQNLDAVRSINRSLKQEHLPKSGVAPQLVAHLKQCAVDLAKPLKDNPTRTGVRSTSFPKRRPCGPRIDKSALTISEPRRTRCKEHLRFVASRPCVICGRRPSHAHHLRHAQTRGLSLKVSDEFTVPLCAVHHSDVHRTGNERSWWKQRNIDPLSIAATLWRESQGRQPVPSTTELEPRKLRAVQPPT